MPLTSYTLLRSGSLSTRYASVMFLKPLSVGVHGFLRGFAGSAPSSLRAGSLRAGSLRAVALADVLAPPVAEALTAVALAAVALAAAAARDGKHSGWLHRMSTSRYLRASSRNALRTSGIGVRRRTPSCPK